MCNRKSLEDRYENLMRYYAASFDAVFEELEYVKERFTILMKKDDWMRTMSVKDTTEIRQRLTDLSGKEPIKNSFTKDELADAKWCFRTLRAFTDKSYRRFHENAYDYLPTPIITLRAPNQFRLFRWGLIPSNIERVDDAMRLRTQTINCISEEMYDKRSYQVALKNNQRCLVPISGFYEYRHVDAASKYKIPYYVSFNDQPVMSMAGLYSRWKDPAGNYYFSYTVLTTPANSVMEYVHNSKKRMPVFIPREREKDWLNENLSQDDVMDLCLSGSALPMKAYAVSKLIGSNTEDADVPDARTPNNYGAQIQLAKQCLLEGDTKRAQEMFKATLGDSASVKDLVNIASEPILEEVV